MRHLNYDDRCLAANTEGTTEGGSSVKPNQAKEVQQENTKTGGKGAGSDSDRSTDRSSADRNAAGNQTQMHPAGPGAEELQGSTTNNQDGSEALTQSPQHQ